MMSKLTYLDQPLYFKLAGEGVRDKGISDHNSCDQSLECLFHARHRPRRELASRRHVFYFIVKGDNVQRVRAVPCLLANKETVVCNSLI